MLEIPAAAEMQFSVFTAEQAHEVGWTRMQLSRAVESGSLWRPRRGAYCLPLHVRSEAGRTSTRSLDDRMLGLRAVAAALRIEAATVGYASALSLYGLPLFDAGASPCVILPPPLRTREAELHVHRHPFTTTNDV
jgi:predicted transcriptional regulator of viral defense system